MFYRGVSSDGDNNTWDTLSWRGGDLALQALGQAPPTVHLPAPSNHTNEEIP